MPKFASGRRFKQLLGKKNKNKHDQDQDSVTALASSPALTEITVSHETSVSSKPRSIQESSPRASTESSQLSTSSVNGDNSRPPTTSSSISIHTPPNELAEFEYQNVKVHQEEDLIPPLIRVQSDESDINSIYSRDQTSVYYPSSPKSRPLALIRKASILSQQSDSSNYSAASANRSFISTTVSSPLAGQLALDSQIDLQDTAVDDVLDDIKPREAEKHEPEPAADDSILLPTDSLHQTEMLDDDASFIEMMSYSKRLSEQRPNTTFEAAPIANNNDDSDPHNSVFAAVRAFQDAGRELDNDMYDSETSSLQDSTPSSPMFSYHSRHTSHSSMTPMTPFTPTFDASFTIKRPNVTSITTIARRSVESIDSYVQDEHVEDEKAVHGTEEYSVQDDPVEENADKPVPYTRTSLDYDEIIRQHLTARSKASPTHIINADEDDLAPQESELVQDFKRRQSSTSSPRPSTMFVPKVEKEPVFHSKEAEDANISDASSPVSSSLSAQGKRSWSSKMRRNFSTSPLLKML